MIVIFRSRPQHLQNRRLSIVLALEGAWYIGGDGILYFTEDAGAAYASQALTEVLYPAMVIGYLLFAGTVFVLSELVEQLLGIDQLVPAILAAAVIALVMRPLARLGERVAAAALPGVGDTDDYRNVRRAELYTAAGGSAMSDGHVTAKEGEVLRTLAEQLGLSGAQARSLEADARAALTV